MTYKSTEKLKEELDIVNKAIEILKEAKDSKNSTAQTKLDAINGLRELISSKNRIKRELEKRKEL